MDSFQKQALVVLDPEQDSTFDPNKPPENGEEYLQRVIYERKFCADIVVVEVPDLIKDQIGLKEKSQEPPTSPTHHSLIPTTEWQAMQAKRFSLLREKLAKLKINPPTKEQLDILPDIDDQTGWHEFCAANPPLCSTITAIKEQNLRIVIEHLLTALAESHTSASFSLATTESWLGQWIYATLSLLHIPLEPYTHSILRDIAKICIKLRNALPENDTVAALPLNLLICIISNNFNQLDLCD